jgi:hypothetical protein
MRKLSYDFIVIGGGAAGMFCAAHVAAAGKSVCVIEQNDRLGKKLYITGKGRCNVTNDCTAEEVLKQIPRNGRFLYSAMNAFPPSETMAFFESRGCKLKVERGNRVFPVSDHASDIIAVLRRELDRTGVTVVHDKAAEILRDDTGVTGVRCAHRTVEGTAVLLATGGCSYPGTGSDGSGYGLASALGHTIVEPRGSLVPLNEDGDWCKQMQGLSLKNVGVRLLNQKNKTVHEDFGELLFTHHGLSGPTILSASAHMNDKDSYTIAIDLKPALDEQKLDQRILRDFGQYQNRTIENALIDLYPRSMIPVMAARAGIDPSTQANAVTKQQRRALLETTKRFTVKIAGRRPVDEAIITAGGVKTGEVDPKTMASKKVPGLYFAGEILDVDAYTGGFNLQIAWATAYAAARAVCDPQ